MSTREEQGGGAARKLSPGISGSPAAASTVPNCMKLAAVCCAEACEGRGSADANRG